MSDSREKLIDAAVGPLEGAGEQEFAVRNLLAEMIRDADPQEIDELVERWHRQGGGRGRRLSRWIALGVLLVLSALFVIPWSALTRAALAMNALSGMLPDNVAVGAMIGKIPDDEEIGRFALVDLDPNQKLLLGDENMPLLERKRRLWESDPENPAYFAEYAMAHTAEKKELPGNFLETANRLDPGNAWFDCLVAAAGTRDCVARSSGLPWLSRSAALWTIHDREKLEKGLEVFHAARSKSRFQTYDASMAAERIKLLPQGDLLEYMASLSFVAGAPSSVLSIRDLTSGLSARIWLAGEEGDVEAFRTYREDGLWLLAMMLDYEDVTILGELATRLLANGIYESIDDAAKKLGVQDEFPDDRAIREKLDDLKAERKSRRSVAENHPGSILEKHGNRISDFTLGGIIFRQVSEPPPISEEELTPFRKAEYALFSAFSALPVWLALGLGSLAVFLYRYRVPVAFRGLSARLAGLLRPVDWAWIVVVGLVLPVAVVSFISQCAPLGGGDLSVSATERGTWLVLPGSHVHAMGILMWISPALVVGWRLKSRARVFGFSSSPWLGVAAVSALLAFCLLFLKLEERALHALLAVVGLWLLGTLGWSIFGRPRQMIHRLAVARALVPVYALGMILLTFVILGFQKSHQSWFERDRFMKLDPDHPGITAYEHKVALLIRKELRALLGMD